MENNRLREPSEQELIIYGNRSLLGEIRPNMRELFLAYNRNEHKITYFFYYDSPPTEEENDYDVEGTIMVEMISDYPELEWDSKSYVIPLPQKIPPPPLGVCIYSRYEPSIDNQNSDRSDIKPIAEKFEVKRSTLVLSANRALLGKIRPEVRNISIEYNEKENRVTLSFFYDCSPGILNVEAIEQSVINQMRLNFSSQIKWETISFFEPFPEINQVSGICVFSRYEKTPN